MNVDEKNVRPSEVSHRLDPHINRSAEFVNEIVRFVPSNSQSVSDTRILFSEVKNKLILTFNRLYLDTLTLNTTKSILITFGNSRKRKGKTQPRSVN